MSLKNSAYHFRQAFADDSAILAKIHEECFPSYWDSSSFTNFFGVKNTRAIVVEAEGPNGREAVAMTVYRIIKEQSDIITIAVRPQWQRQGLAYELMERAIAHAKALGAISMFLDVEEGNLPAMKLYDRLGFSVINRRKDYYKQKDASYTDALVMTCEFT